MIGGGGDIDLGALVEFVLVPAVRDAALDAAESPTGGFRQLVELLVRTRLDVGEQLAALPEEIDARYAEIISNDGDTILAETSTLLSERLAALAPGTAVQVRWAPQITLDPPAVRAALVESNFSADVGRQGHGVRRASLVALLQALAEARATTDGAADRRLLILALEEPELYQHLLRARDLAGVLQQLT
jgi:putative ATP-dependent endonuclease of the OLD family